MSNHPEIKLPHPDIESLYAHLMARCEEDATPFYFKDFTVEENRHAPKHYRIFSYHAAIPRDFLTPLDREARGIMFEIDHCGRVLDVASRPMEKFFNHGEHPEFDVKDIEDYDRLFDKVDGSLISTYMYNGSLRLKSKASLSSDHALAAMEWLNRKENTMLKHWLHIATAFQDTTINMEWVSPEFPFRIVVHYPEPKLVVLNGRNKYTGEYVPYRILEQAAMTIDFPLANQITLDRSVVDTVQSMVGQEGFVVIGNCGEKVKLKSPWYVERHRAKDFLNRPNAFIEMVINDQYDDVRELVKDQPDALAQADDMAYKITRTINTIINNVTEFWKDNKDLGRKEYAVKGQAELTRHEFTLAMKYYTSGDEPNWNEFFLKWVKKLDWGFDTEEKEAE